MPFPGSMSLRDPSPIPTPSQLENARKRDGNARDQPLFPCAATGWSRDALEHPWKACTHDWKEDRDRRADHARGRPARPENINMATVGGCVLKSGARLTALSVPAAVREARASLGVRQRAGRRCSNCTCRRFRTLMRRRQVHCKTWSTPKAPGRSAAPGGFLQVQPQGAA